MIFEILAIFEIWPEMKNISLEKYRKMKKKFEKFVKIEKVKRIGKVTDRCSLILASEIFSKTIPGKDSPPFSEKARPIRKKLVELSGKTAFSIGKAGLFRPKVIWIAV